MRRTEALQGVRTIKFLSILSRYEAAEFSQVEVERATVNVVRHDFHGEWKYTISPKSKALQQ